MRKMKDSGIEWIGEIPEGWEVSQLKYATRWKSEKGCPDAPVLSLYRDFGVVPKDSRDDNHNVTSLDTSNYKVVDIGDLVVNKMKAWQGSMAVSDYRGIVSPAYHVCSITSNKVNKRYLHHLLRNPAYLPEYARLSTGMRIGQWDLGFDDFKNIPFLIPPLDEQAKIADYLDNSCASLDAMLSKIRSSIEEYKKLKQAVITQAVTKGVRGEREMKKDSRVEWIGEIPKEWDIIKSSRIIKTTQNGLSRRDLEKSEGQIILKLKNITSDGKIDYSFLNRITLSQNELNTYALTTGDFLFVRVNGSKSLVGKCAIFEAISEIVAYNDHIIRVKLSNQCYNRFFLWYLYSCCGKAEIDLHTSTSAGQYTISGDGLRDITLVFPPIDEQKEIADYLDAKCAEIDGLIAKKEQLVKELESYKKSLIYEVVTGKREV